MTMLLSFVWPWWGGWMYWTVTGVTSDVSVPLTCLVGNDLHLVKMENGSWLFSQPCWTTKPDIPSTFLTILAQWYPMATEIWVNIGLGKWLVAWRKQVITWTNVDLSSSMGFCGTHQWPFSQEVLKILIGKMSLKNTLVNLLPHLSGANELTHWGRDEMNNISQTTFSNVFSSMKMFEFHLKFHRSLFPRAQLTIFQHWFR